MIAVVPVRDGRPVPGGSEAVAEMRGRALLVGDGARAAVEHLDGAPVEVTVCEQPAFRPGALAAALALVVDDDDIVLLPASADGRDLAPRLAQELRRQFLAGCVRVEPGLARRARLGGLLLQDMDVRGPVVATLQVGVRSVPERVGTAPVVREIQLDLPEEHHDAAVLEVLPPDPATMDLSEALRILGGGAGLRTHESFELLARVAHALGASRGATRVVTDLGWVPFERQIGTTGVEVDPDLYIAFGISGAVQHVAGLGSPDHVVSVNTDPSCPMMAMAGLAIVADAPATLRALAERLGVPDGEGDVEGAQQ